MEKLTTAKKREIDCDYLTVNSSQSKIYIQAHNISVADAASVFDDPTETIHLWFGDLHLENYTRLASIVPGDGSIRVALRRE